MPGLSRLSFGDFMLDPRFPIRLPLHLIRWLKARLERILNQPPHLWAGKHRLSFSRIESAFEAVEAAEEHKVLLTRQEASTLAAYAQMVLEQEEPLTYEGFFYMGREDAWDAQKAAWEAEQEPTRYPGVLEDALPRFELLAGLRTSLPGQVIPSVHARS